MMDELAAWWEDLKRALTWLFWRLVLDAVDAYVGTPP